MFYNEPIQELLDRTRRIEMRLTRFMEDNRFDTGVRRPIWYPEEGRLEVPSPATSLKDIIAAVPRSWPATKAICWRRSTYRDYSTATQ